MKQRKPLKPTDIAVLKGKVAGKKNVTIGAEVFPEMTPGAANVTVTRVLKNANVQEELAKAFKRKGITIDKVVQPVADGLTAEREYYTDKQGNERGGGADHTTRLRASSMAAQWMGIGKAEGGETINNFIIVASDQKEKYGM